MIDIDEATVGGELRRLADALVPDDDHAAAIDAMNRVDGAGTDRLRSSSTRRSPSRPRALSMAAALIMLAGVAATIAVWATRDQAPAAIDAAIPPEQPAEPVDLIVYVTPGADQQALDAVRAAITAHNDVVDVGRLRYLDFEASLARARQLLAGDDETFALLDEQNLPTQFDIWALPGRLADLATVRNDLVSKPFVQHVAIDGASRFDLEPPLTTEQQTTSASTMETTFETPQTLAADEWLIPTFVDDPLTFNHAMIDGNERTLTYTTAELDQGFTITIAGPDLGVDSKTATATEIDGHSWRITDTGDDTTWFSTDIGGTAVQVVFFQFDPALAIAVVGSLQVDDSTALPRPPIDLDRSAFKLAATDDDGSGEVTLMAVTDGHYYCVQVADAGSCVGTISDQIAIRSSQMLLSDGRAVAYGVIRSDVATVRLALSDGRTVDVTPQDVDDSFPANFYVAVGAYSSGLAVLSATPLDITGAPIPTLDIGP